MSEEERKQPAPTIREKDRAASGAPKSGWAVSDRFSWDEIHQRILVAADEEIASAPRELFFSGATAGFAIILTLIGYAVGSAYFPDNPFLASILYPIGFIYIIMGRYQLYTENTLPPVKLVLTKLASLPLLFRLWAIVLFANVVGAAAGSLLIANTEVLGEEAMNQALGFATHALEMSWWSIFSRALFAGWLVAGVVWLITSAKDSMSRFIIIYFVFYTIAVCDLFHVVTAASKVMIVIFHGNYAHTIVELIASYWLPVLIGNTVGGVMAFAFMAYAQSERKRYPEVRELSAKEVFFSMKGGRPFATPRPRTDWTDGEVEEKEQEQKT